MKIHVHNWTSRQTFARKSPDWIKVYTDLSEHSKTKDLNNQALGLLVRLWVLASKYGNGFDIEDYYPMSKSDLKALSILEYKRLIRRTQIEKKEETSSLRSSESARLRLAERVLSYLNAKTGRTGSKKYTDTSMITKRVIDGASEEELIAVIDSKVLDWDGTEFAKYLRPATLFSAKNFLAYIEDVRAGNGATQGESVFARGPK